jgi:hypothetical protein
MFRCWLLFLLAGAARITVVAGDDKLDVHDVEFHEFLLQ